jgi:pre-mRNA-splicing factor SYF1
LEEYANYLVSVGYVDEAAKILTRIVNDDHFISRQGKSRHELWMQLCDILTQHPEQIHSVRVEPIIRSALAKYTNEVGKLWTSLADYYVRLGNFEKARDVFEEGINSVVTVRDFSQIWDAYNQFEYGLITAHMEEQQDPALVDAFELRMARFEDLIDRQPLLISNVLLRQNPHNVYVRTCLIREYIVIAADHVTRRSGTNASNCSTMIRSASSKNTRAAAPLSTLNAPPAS